MNHVLENLKAQGLSEEKLAHLFEGWEAHDYVVNGQIVGTGMVKGTEIHFALDANHRKSAMKRGAMREAIQPLLDRLGFLTTRILVGHAEQSKFVERVGFEKTWSDGRFTYYLLANLPYERKAK